MSILSSTIRRLAVIATLLAGTLGAGHALAAQHGNSHGTNVRQVESTLLVDIVTDDGQARTVEVTGLFLAVDYSAYFLDLAGRLQVAQWPYIGHNTTAVSETGYEYTLKFHTVGLDKTQ